MYLKIFRENDNHHGFQYKDGLNVDTNKFRERGSCVPGGLYFTTIENITEFLKYGNYIRVVEVPEGAEMVKDPEGNKWRASSLFLHPRKSLYNVDTWKWLIEQGVIISNAISWASSEGYLTIVELLLKYNVVPIIYSNAIMYASEQGHLEVVELLLKHGADCTVNRNSAIRYAALNGYLTIVKLLLKHGADCTDLNNYAIRYANDRGHSEIVELLLKHGATLESKGNVNVFKNIRKG